MPQSGSTAGRAPRSAASRVRLAWRVLPPERRLAALAAVALFATLFLPWYQETVIPTGFARHATLPSASLTGWAAFSFVEAAVLLVSLAVLSLLFFRAEGRAFHVPGGDGGVVTAAGFWTGVLILWRMFDKSGTEGHGQFVTTSGIEWGIFIALGVAGLLAYSGQRIRLQHEAEPPLPGERPRRGRRRGRRDEEGAGPVPDPDAGWLTPDSHGRRPNRPGHPEAPERPARPSAATVRPRPAASGAPTVHARPDDSEAPTIHREPDSEAPTVRARPADSEAPTVPGHGEPDDQLTIPLDRPE